MTSEVGFYPAWSQPSLSRGLLPKAALVSAAYFIGAEAAFLIGTFSDRIFAPFWPPNVILFCALLLAPRRHWWVYIAAAFPAHVLAEAHVGMHAPQNLVAFATNGLVAVLSASILRTGLSEAPWLGSLRKAALYILIAAVVSPAISSLGGAFVPILSGGAADRYLEYWMQWYFSNALGFLTLGPFFLIWFSKEALSPRTIPLQRLVEGIVLAAGLVVVCASAFRISAAAVTIGYLPAVLYSPLPLILWAAVRFGQRGASGAVLVVTIVSLWLTLNSSSFFIAGSPETNVLALQIFLISFSAPVLLLGASMDEGRHAERAIRESEERMAFAAASANIGLWYLEADTERLWATEHCRSMLGLAADAPLTRASILEAIHADDRQSTIEAIRSAAQSGEDVASEFRVVLPGGEVRWFRTRARADRDDRGKPFRISGIFSDITAAKMAEHEADLQRRELAHLTRVAVMGELSGAIAHELNQPLTAILSNAQAAQLMLANDAPDLGDIGQAIDDIVIEDKRAGEVIERLRGLLRKDEGKRASLEINELVLSTLQLLHSEIISRRINVITNLGRDLPPIWGDRVQLQQVLLNLVMNAMEAMASVSSDRRAVTISTRQLINNQIETIVSDLGPGLGPDGERRALEPFFTTKPHGLGLGLSICSTIVTSHGGTLQLSNNRRGGVRACFSLPSECPAEVLA
jgi:PAS domain S-box-containing protein